MAWCPPATNHYLRQWWPRSMLPYSHNQLTYWGLKNDPLFAISLLINVSPLKLMHFDPVSPMNLIIAQCCNDSNKQCCQCSIIMLSSCAFITFLSASWRLWRCSLFCKISYNSYHSASITANLLQSLHNKYTIACPWGGAVRCLFWGQDMINVLTLQMPICMQWYH